jgi:hypothetical protein
MGQQASHELMGCALGQANMLLGPEQLDVGQCGFDSVADSAAPI